MVRRVLVVLRAAAVTDRMVPWVGRLVAPMGGEIRLLSVLAQPSAACAGSRTVACAHQREEAARLTALLSLETLAASLRDDGLLATSEVRFGDPVAAALDAARDWGAEMIAVADGAAAGDLVDDILHRSPVPVLLAVAAGDRVA